MIIGGDKKLVIENIRKNVNNGKLSKKAELNDPVFSDKEAYTAIEKFNKNRQHKFSHAIKSLGAYAIVNYAWWQHRNNTTFDGLEKIKKLNKGAIITCNHFNPIDSIFVHAALKKMGRKNPYIVIQVANLGWTDWKAFLMNNMKMIPIIKSPNYLLNTVIPRVKKLCKNGEFVLIYPEEELWFNYRKPRPCKRGAYVFAAQANVPILPIFIEMNDTNVSDNDQFNILKYVVHILDPIYPDPKKTKRQNSKVMAAKDYEERKQAYEKYYGKKLDYKFSYDDIAGYKI